MGNLTKALIFVGVLILAIFALDSMATLLNQYNDLAVTGGICGLGEIVIIVAFAYKLLFQKGK